MVKRIKEMKKSELKWYVRRMLREVKELCKELFMMYLDKMDDEKLYEMCKEYERELLEVVEICRKKKWFNILEIIENELKVGDYVLWYIEYEEKRKYR